ncbi:MAG: hypothetical protein AAGI44_05980 [Pseudomonadota bacterium]
MSSQRARANHSLYLAKIVTQAWRDELEKERIASLTLTQAFLEPIRSHLLAAYGWFLLATCNAEPPADGTLPHRCDDLQPMPEGRLFPPEINEFRQLEGGGWLQSMLSETEVQSTAVRSPGSLAVSVNDSPAIAQVEHWLSELEGLMNRMGDSLDEY